MKLIESHSAKHAPTPYRQRGLGIIEVLVALVVVSFGVLGMASLQLTGMKHSTGGYNRSKALMFTENMATRMRVNSTGVEQARYATFDSDTLNCDIPPDPYCQATLVGGEVLSCDAGQLAAFDFFSVACGDVGKSAAEDGVKRKLRDGRLTVDCNSPVCSEESTYTITVSWSEGRSTIDKSKPAAGNLDESTTRRVQMRLRP